MSADVKAALERLLRRYVDHRERVTGSLPTQDFDSAWVSHCQIGAPNADGIIHWKPRERDTVADFTGLERALETEIHPDIKSFYGSYWSGVLELRAEEGGVTLIQIWNDDDFDRLIENILGHAMAKLRKKEPLTIFVACTDEEEHILSVDNETGQVLLEEPGNAPIRAVSPTLAEFLDRLEPVTRSAR
jgi:SecY interacting protein Syd